MQLEEVHFNHDVNSVSSDAYASAALGPQVTSGARFSGGPNHGQRRIRAIDAWFAHSLAVGRSAHSKSRSASHASLPEKMGDEGYVKFFVSGATVVRSDETRGVLRLTARSPGEALVEVFLVEPGRQANSGRLALRIE